MALSGGLSGALAQGALGTLFVRLTADPSKMISGMAAAEKSVTSASAKIGNGLKRVSAAAVAAFAAVAGATAVFTKKTIDSADAMLEHAQIAGQNVRQFSALAHAASMASVSQQDLAMASKFLTQWMERNNVTTTNLTEELVRQADQFASMADGPEKLRMAYDRFGRSGAQLLPLLNQGSAALREQMKEAREFGAVVSEKFGADADTFNDNIARITLAFKGLFIQVVEKMIPSWIAMQERFIAWIKDADNQKKAVELLTDVFVTITNVVKIFASVVMVVWTVLKLVGNIIGTLVAVGLANLKAGFNAMIKLGKIWFDGIKAIGQALATLADAAVDTGGVMFNIVSGNFEAAADAALDVIFNVKKGFGDIGDAVAKGLTDAGGVIIETVKGAAENSVEVWADAIVRMQGDWATMLNVLDLLWAESTNNRTEATKKAAAEFTNTFDQMAKAESDKVMELINKLGAPKMQSFDPFTQATMDTQGEIAAHEDALRQLQNILAQKQNITEEAQLATLEAIQAYNAKLKELQMQQAVIIVESAQSMFDQLASTTEQFAGKQSGAYKAMFAASKAFAVAESVVKIQQGIASALSLGWPMGLVAAASVVAQAANIVSTIKSVQLEFGGEKAMGGPVTPGKAFLVGEQGPELFTPGQAGNITPNEMLGGGRDVKVIVNNFTDAKTEVTERNEGGERQIEVIIRRVKSEIGSEIRDGRGDVNKAMESSFSLRRGGGGGAK